MSHSVFRLFPPPYEEVCLKGLYLGLNLQELGTPSEPFVYANFLSSLDGRIAVENPTGEARLPKTLTSPADFRLFLELEAQADCLITHGGYLRALQAGKLGNILTIGQREEDSDLLPWRLERGLAPQPAIIIASASLDFPMPGCIREHGQVCHIATGQNAEHAKIRHWQNEGYEVIIAGKDRLVEGVPLLHALGERGFCRPYLIAGPDMLDTMVRGEKLSRLFQTITHQLMGGVAFRTVSPGAEYGPFGHLKLRSLYYDPHSPQDTGQWFAQFELAKR